MQADESRDMHQLILQFKTYLHSWFFVFSSKSKRDQINQTVWCGIAARAMILNMCHFWQTEPSSHPDWDNLVTFERKFKLHNKSNQSKQLTQETGHILYPSIQREGIFIFLFFLQTEQFYHGFSYFSTGKLGQDEIKDRHQTLPGHILNHHVFNKNM